MKIAKWIFLIFLFVSQYSWGTTNYMIGDELLTTCDDEVLLVACASYIGGVADMHNVMVESGYIRRLWCIPNNTTAGQLIQVVLDYLKATPEHMNKDASGLVMIAFMKNFPCD